MYASLIRYVGLAVVFFGIGYAVSTIVSVANADGNPIGFTLKGTAQATGGGTSKSGSKAVRVESTPDPCQSGSCSIVFDIAGSKTMLPPAPECPKAQRCYTFSDATLSMTVVEEDGTKGVTMHVSGFLAHQAKP